MSTLGISPMSWQGCFILDFMQRNFTMYILFEKRKAFIGLTVLHTVAVWIRGPSSRARRVNIRCGSVLVASRFCWRCGIQCLHSTGRLVPALPAVFGPGSCIGGRPGANTRRLTLALPIDGLRLRERSIALWQGGVVWMVRQIDADRQLRFIIEHWVRTRTP